MQTLCECIVSLCCVRFTMCTASFLTSPFHSLQSLGLRNVVMPVAALPLLAGMTKLRDVTVEVSRMEHIAMDELAAALCVLGQQAGSSLEHIKVVVHDAYEGALGFADAICDYLDGLGKGHVHVGVMALQHDEE